MHEYAVDVVLPCVCCQHEEALKIYAGVLHDDRTAEDYVNSVFQETEDKVRFRGYPAAVGRLGWFGLVSLWRRFEPGLLCACGVCERRRSSLL